MRPVRAIVYGVGAMGLIMTRLLHEKGIDIVGAVARSRAKVGRDLGELAGLPEPLGVLVTDDALSLMSSTHADVALVSVSSYLEPMAPHFRTCLGAGVNVITLEEETLYPWRSSPEVAAELDQLARETGATLMASGAQELFWVLQPALLMGAAHQIERVRGRTTWDARDYGPEVLTRLHVGQPVASFAPEEAVNPESWGAMVGRTTLEALCAQTGLSIKSVTSRVIPLTAASPQDASGHVPRIETGHVRGISEVVTLQSVEGPVLELEMAGFVHVAGEHPTTEWHLHGTPGLFVSNGRWEGLMVTCTTMVNRIPDVLAAPPGLLTLDRLPVPRCRWGPMLTD